MIEPSILHYCTYQERCHKEVRNKLYELGFTANTVNLQISELIEAGILNEERFAIAFARGKFRMLHWGRVKIKQQLTFRGVSDYCIKKALKEISEDDYARQLKKLAQKKWETVKTERSVRIKKSKVSLFLLQKGYERNLVMDILKEITG